MQYCSSTSVALLVCSKEFLPSVAAAAAAVSLSRALYQSLNHIRPKYRRIHKEKATKLRKG